MGKMTKAELRWHMYKLVEEHGEEKAKLFRAMEISRARSDAAKKRHAAGKGSYRKENDMSVADVRSIVPEGWTVVRDRAPGRVGGHGDWHAKGPIYTVSASTGERLISDLQFRGILPKDNGELPDVL